MYKTFEILNKYLKNLETLDPGTVPKTSHIIIAYIATALLRQLISPLSLVDRLLQAIILLLKD